MCLRLSLLLMCIGLSQPLLAGLNFFLEQSGDDVVLTLTGSANLDGLEIEGVGGAGFGSIGPAEGDFMTATGTIDGYLGVTGPDSFGVGEGTAATEFSGDSVGIIGGYGLLVPYEYQSGDPLSAMATWENTTLAELGVSLGVYHYTWTGDTATLTVVPEPAYFALTLGLAAALMRYRHRRKY